MNRAFARPRVAAVAGVVTISLFPQAAWAHHTAGSEAASFLTGLGHPLTGLDHVLAMLAVGLWAAQLGGRAVWLLPSTFVAVMLGGAALGIGGVRLGFVESMIIASVPVLGLAIAIAARLPAYAAAFVAGGFALFHGHAHGTELTGVTAALTYVAGLSASSAALLAAGAASTLALRSGASSRAVRVAGTAIALGGACVWLTR